MKTFTVALTIIFSVFYSSELSAQLQVTFSGDTTIIWDKNVDVACETRFKLIVDLTNDSISVLEQDTSSRHATCNCYYNLSAKIVGLEAGTYTAYVKRKLNYGIDTTYEIGSLSFGVSTNPVQAFSVHSFQGNCHQTPDAVEESGNSGKSFYLLTNYPNPFNPVTIIRYAIPKSGYLKVTVYDSRGSLIKVVAEKYSIEGAYEIQFDGRGYSSGIYIIRLETKDSNLSIKTVLLK